MKTPSEPRNPNTEKAPYSPVKILDIALKDLRQMATDWQTPVFLLVMPVLFTIFFGIAFAGQGEVDPRVPIAAPNQDDGFLSARIVDTLTASKIVRLVDVGETSPEALKTMIQDEDIAAALVLPAGYTDAALGGEPPQLSVWFDSDTQEGHAAKNEINAKLLQALSAAQIGRIVAEIRGEASAFPSVAARGAFVDTSTKAALDAWENPTFTIETELASKSLEEGGLTNSYAQSSPGMMIQFAITGVMSSASLLVIERKSRSLQRMLTTPTGRGEIIAGKLLSSFLLIFGQLVILTVFGQVAYDLPYYNHPAALLLLSAVFALTLASMGLLIGSIAKNEEMVIVMVMIPMFILSALGGAWFPLETMSRTMQRIGKIITPTAWMMEGYQDIIVRGQGLSAVWLPVAVVLAWGALLFVLAVWRLDFVER